MDVPEEFSWLGWGIVVGFEALALALGATLAHYGLIAWYIVPPLLAIVLGFVLLANAEANGVNPFQ